MDLALSSGQTGENMLVNGATENNMVRVFILIEMVEKEGVLGKKEKGSVGLILALESKFNRSRKMKND